jgi:hypothetical protein
MLKKTYEIKKLYWVHFSFIIHYITAPLHINTKVVILHEEMWTNAT